MAAYDAKEAKNEFPKMLYKGTDYRVVSNDKEEAEAHKAGYDKDTPSGRVVPIGRDVMPKQKPAPATASIEALEARIAALEAEVFHDDDKPAPKKGK